jgi:hypothetical protein
LECWLLSRVGSRPACQRDRQNVRCGPPIFDMARQWLLPKFTEADFTAYRRHCAFDQWKRAMWDAGLKLPTQVANGPSTCFCGATIGIADMESHVYTAHTESA